MGLAAAHDDRERHRHVDRIGVRAVRERVAVPHRVARSRPAGGHACRACRSFRPARRHARRTRRRLNALTIAPDEAMPCAGSSSSRTSPPASAIESLKGACRIVTRSERVARIDRSCCRGDRRRLAGGRERQDGVRVVAAELACRREAHADDVRALRGHRHDRPRVPKCQRGRRPAGGPHRADRRPLRAAGSGGEEERDRDRRRPRESVHGPPPEKTGAIILATADIAVVQAFRPAASGGPEGPHYIRNDVSRRSCPAALTPHRPLPSSGRRCPDRWFLSLTCPTRSLPRRSWATGSRSIRSQLSWLRPATAPSCNCTAPATRSR